MEIRNYSQAELDQAEEGGEGDHDNMDQDGTES